MWRVPPIWKNGECVILGGGTSFIKQFNIPKEVVDKVYSGQALPNIYSPYLEAIHNKHVIGVNMAYKLGDWVDCLYFGDGGFLAAHRSDIFDFKGLRITSTPRPSIHNSYLKIVDRNKNAQHA